MIPRALPLLVLALAAWRTYRLISLDDLPLLVRIRNWLVGAEFHGSRPPTFKRPTLADWLSCGWCSGLWWSVGWYAAWLEQSRYTLYAAAPLAINAAWMALERLHEE
jgi:hypothetical protein